jgi:hypothetical protein
MKRVIIILAVVICIIATAYISYHDGYKTALPKDCPECPPQEIKPEIIVVQNATGYLNPGYFVAFNNEFHRQETKTGYIDIRTTVLRIYHIDESVPWMVCHYDDDPDRIMFEATYLRDTTVNIDTTCFRVTEETCKETP